MILASNEDLVHEVAKEFKDLNYKCASIVANVKNKKEVEKYLILLKKNLIKLMFPSTCWCNYNSKSRRFN